MKLPSLCVLKYCFIFTAILISLHLASTFYNKREGFFNMEKKYKKIKRKINRGISKNLESMINILPNFNIRNNVRRLKRKYI